MPWMIIFVQLEKFWSLNYRIGEADIKGIYPQDWRIHSSLNQYVALDLKDTWIQRKHQALIALVVNW